MIGVDVSESPKHFRCEKILASDEEPGSEDSDL